MKNNRGITLIALIVTIIVLLILTGVSVSTLSSNGIISKAIKAREETKIAELKEWIGIKVNESAIESSPEKNTLTNIKKCIDENKEKRKVTTNLNEDKTELEIEIDGYVFTITENENGMQVKYIGESGNLQGVILGIEKVKKLNSIEVTVKSKYVADEKYRYSIKKMGEGEFKEKETTKENVFEYKELEKNTVYTIKIEIVDGKNVVSSYSENVSTKTIEDLTVANTTVKVEPKEYSKTATVTIETSLENYKLQYRTSKTGEEGEVETWTDYSSPITLNRNQSIFIRAIDEEGDNGDTLTEVIEKIDRLDPTGDVEIESITTNSATVKVNAIDAEATEDYAKSGIKGYYYSSDGTTWTEMTTETTHTFNNLARGTTYTFRVKVEDNAGNVTELTKDGTTVKELTAERTIEAGNMTNGSTTLTLRGKVNGDTIQKVQIYVGGNKVLEETVGKEEVNKQVNSGYIDFYKEKVCYGVLIDSEGVQYKTDEITIKNEDTIKTAEDLNELARIVNNTEETFKGKTINQIANITTTENYEPIGYWDGTTEGWSGKYFAGTYEGNGKEITLSSITKDSKYKSIGIFGMVIEGNINNLTVNGTNASTVRNTGGIVGGQNKGSINGCTNNCELTGNTNTSSVKGGIVGSASELRVNNCTNNVEIKGYTSIGGIVGSANNYSTIENCTNNGGISRIRRCRGDILLVEYFRNSICVRSRWNSRND